MSPAKLEATDIVGFSAKLLEYSCRNPWVKVPKAPQFYDRIK